MRSILVSLFLSLFICSSYSQTVSTYAGLQYTGTGSFTGFRNNKKDSVLFSAPMGIEVDTAGRIYVSNEHNIFWIKDKTCFLAVGYNLDPTDPGAADSKDFAGSVARFSRPAGLAINPNTNELMVADQDNNQIRKVERFINNSTQQIVSTFAGVKLLNGAHLDAANANAKFNAPVGIAVASNGDVFVADRNNHCIRKISGGNVTTLAGSAGNPGHVNGTGTAAKFAAPYNVFIDGNDLYVADYGNSAIRKINISTGAVTDFITSGLFGPKDLCKVGNAFFIVEDLCVKRYDNNVLKLYVGSSSQQGFVDGESTSVRFQSLSSIVYHPIEKLMYVVDQGNNVVRSITPNLKPICNFTVSTTTATKGQTIILKSTTTNEPESFKWTITPGSFTLLNNSKITDSIIYVSMSQTGTYSVKLWATNSSGNDSLSKNNLIAVSSNTAKPAVAFMASDVTPDVNQIISLIDLSANTPTNWIWRISPPNYIWMNGTDSNSQIPNVKFTNGDNFTVTLIAGNAEGANSLTKTEYIKVNGSSILSLQRNLIATIYPNPANDFVNLEVENNSIVYIYDVYGKLLETIVSDNEIVRINLEQYNNGIYTAIVVNNRQRTSGKFIVNH
jgi:PKD repeat protein